VQIIPKDETFSEEATHLGDVISGYARLIAWTSDPATGDAMVCQAGDLHNGYFQNGTQGGQLPGTMQVGTTGRFAVARFPGGAESDSDVIGFVWRKFFSVRAKASMSFRWRRISGTQTTASFRRAAVGVRLAGHTVYTNTANAESVTGGDGYWLVVRNVATQPGLRFFLLRVNAGVTTVLASTTAVDVATMQLGTGMWISLLASNVAGNPTLRCRRGSTGPQLPGVQVEIDIFGADIVDTSGSKITAAGRCGFGVSKPIAGSATFVDWFDVHDPSTATTVLHDDWTRSNYSTGFQFGADANGVSGRSLIAGFMGGVGGSGGQNVGRDTAVANQAMNYASATTVNGLWPYMATHDAIQRREITAAFSTPGGRSDTLDLDLRGSRLDAPTAVGAFGYRARLLVTGTGPSVVVALLRILNGTTMTVGIKTTALVVATHTLDMQIDNFGGATPQEGAVNIVVRVNGSIISGWAMTPQPGISQLADGTIVDSSSSAVRTGWEQGWRFTMTSAAAAAVKIDNWLDTATLPTSDNDIPSASVSTEVTGQSGTLVLPLTWPAEEILDFPATRHEYDSDHAQTQARGSRIRRIWEVGAEAAKESERDTLIAFYTARGGTQVPFAWTTPDGEAVVVVFLTTDLEDALKARRAASDVFSFTFRLQERFAT